MSDQTHALLVETHNNLREQLTAAQRHFERLEQLLVTRENRVIAELNRAARRLRAAGAVDWGKVLVEVCAPFCARAALFRVQESSLHLEAARGTPDRLEDVPLHAAPAFRAAVESKDPLLALRTRGEMSASIADCFGEEAGGRFHLLPISAGERITAVLYADGPGSVQADALELLATLAGAVLETRLGRPAEGLVKISLALAPTDRGLHLKAQRFARVQVAQMRLYRDQDVKTGRAERNLYVSLKTQIDSAREAFQREFLAGSEDMDDYLHQELVNTLARGDVELLGPDYPGPLL
ncbi:MAG TPA: hypothetical protein VKX49_07400 [Bryobacteraceae bacterium]|nr:hypothetical protein [Bryobacteraceae bacterium]